MSGHTPGPWIYNGQFGHTVYVGTIDEPRIIHDVSHDSPDGKPNARLIAAAPDLLEALQLLHDDIAEYARINNLGGFDNHVMKLARAAIAKATGEAA